MVSSPGYCRSAKGVKAKVGGVKLKGTEEGGEGGTNHGGRKGVEA